MIILRGPHGSLVVGSVGSPGVEGGVYVLETN